MSQVGSGNKRRMEAVGDFFADFYPESREDAWKIKAVTQLRLLLVGDKGFWGENSRAG